jgi:hypothetical protein
MMHPVDYAFTQRGAIGLDGSGEVGLLFCQDDDGQHQTLIGQAALLRAALADHLGLDLLLDAFQLQRAGWPHEW